MGWVVIYKYINVLYFGYILRYKDCQVNIYKNINNNTRQYAKTLYSNGMNTPENPQKKLVLIDGNALMHRAYHGMNRGFTPALSDGTPVGMVYGFCSTVLWLLPLFRPDHFVVTFDTKEKTFRHDADENYKAQRTKAPDDFYPQVPHIERFLDAMNVPILKAPGYESDDIIGTLVTRAQAMNFESKIISADMDFLQLCDASTTLVKPQGQGDPVVYTHETVTEKYGVTVEQFVDYKAIMGDASDNYKGVAGIGPKGAQKLIAEFGSIDNIYKNIDQIPEKIQQKLMTDKEYLLHCQYLAAIHCDVPIDHDITQNYHIHHAAPEDFFVNMRFSALHRRWKKLLLAWDAPVIPEAEQGSLF